MCFEIVISFLSVSSCTILLPTLQPYIVDISHSVDSRFWGILLLSTGTMLNQLQRNL